MLENKGGILADRYNPCHSLRASSRRVLTGFSVQPLCSLCLCGCSFSPQNHHRGTENTEVAQRFSKETHATPCNLSTSSTPGTPLIEPITRSRCLTSNTSTVTSI